MKPSARFIDTNVLLYLLSADEARADRAEATLAGGGVLSVQVLNEFASVALRKLGMSTGEIRETLTTVRAVCSVVPLSEETHELGLQIVERYGMSIYDAMVVASALLAGCDELLSEDLQDGQIIEGRLRIRNPFSGPTE
jgi:predicted nucleic acid-binding protein